LKANPNNADLLAESAEPYFFGGQPQEGIRRVREAMRLNPYHPNLYVWFVGFGQYLKAGLPR
jgi:adenylate cyclase